MTTSLEHKRTSFYWIKKKSGELRVEPCVLRMVTKIPSTFKILLGIGGTTPIFGN